MNEAFAIQGFSASNTMICFIEGSEIYQTDCYGGKKLIGRTEAAYGELEATTTEYYNKLVELGVIVPPKTQEQMVESLQQSMLEMSKIIQSLTNEVKELKGHECKCRNTNGGEDVSGAEFTRNSRKSTKPDTRSAGQPARRDAGGTELGTEQDDDR